MMWAEEAPCEPRPPIQGFPWPYKDLGAILAKKGDSLQALYFLRQSFKIDLQDPQTVFDLAFAYMVLGDI